jgi:thioredoxin-related protein
MSCGAVVRETISGRRLPLFKTILPITRSQRFGLIMTVRTTFTCLPMALVILAAGVTFAAAPDTRNPREFFFTQTFGDLPEEMQIAADDGKLGMLLFFEAEDCGYCRRMLKQVFSQRSVQDWYTERFVNIAVDVFGDVELKDFDGITLPSKVFADQRRIFATPVVSFIDLNGIEMYRHFGMIKTAEEFLLLGEYIEDKHYFDTEYQVFLRSQGKKVSTEILTTPASLGDAN